MYDRFFVRFAFVLNNSNYFSSLLACASVCLFVGYSGIRHFYDNPDTAAEPETGGERISHVAFVVLVACAFLTGAGGNGGLTSSVNATAKSFPDEMVRIFLRS